MKSKKKILIKIMTAFIFITIMLLLQSSLVFADGKFDDKEHGRDEVGTENSGIVDFNGGVSYEALSKAREVYAPVVKYITAIFTPTAVVAVGFCLSGMMLCFGGKSTEAYYGWLKKIFSAWITFSCLRAIINMLFALALNTA